MTEKPITLLPEDIQRIMGKDAQRNNILAAKMVAEVVKTTLGPKGMDKMLVAPTGEITITNDGVTILEEMQIEHPAAKMVAEVAKTQESEVGDGTTTAVMLAGKLLERAETLLDQKIHPTVITKGYALARDHAMKILSEIAVPLEQTNVSVLEQIAMTAMTGKNAESAKERLAQLLVRAVLQIKTEKGIVKEDIRITKIRGETPKDSILLQGLMLEKNAVTTEMPEKITSAQILLLDTPIEIKSPDMQTKIAINAPEQLEHFLAQEEKTLEDHVQKIRRVGANVVFCQKGIDDFAAYLLAQAGIFAVKRVSRVDMEALSKATSAKIATNLSALSAQELGRAEVVERVQLNDEIYTLIRGCPKPLAVTIVLHGGTPHVLDEIERAIQDGIGDVVSAINSGKIVAGGGAVEIELSKRLKEFATTKDGREQLAIQEFATALECIPFTLAENAGLDPVDVVTELKARHNRGEIHTGINLLTNTIGSMLDAKVIEPYKVKEQAINAATDVAVMMLRIDDVIAAKPKRNEPVFGKLPQSEGGLL